MLLVLDVGNSNIVIGLYDGDCLLNHWRLETKNQYTSDELGALVTELLMSKNFTATQITEISMASVVPVLNSTLLDLCARTFHLNPFVVQSGIKTGLKTILYQAQELGADRIVNAAAAYHKYQKDLIVIDLGTATTLDVVSQNGEYCGGVICAGINTLGEALFRRLPQLPRVEIAKPAHVVGTNTVACMQSGLYFGYIGMIDSLVERIQKETSKKYHVIATGGLARLIAKDSSTIVETDDLLTLKGLKLLYDLNL